MAVAMLPIGLLAAPYAYAAKRALLIGIDQYQTVQPLVGSVNDVRNMDRFLRSFWGFEPGDIKMLVNDEATKTGILSAIDSWLIQSTRSGDDILFYYSGHGYQQPDDNGDEEDGLDETLVPVDVHVSPEGTFGNMISDDEIDEMLGLLSDRKVTVIIDSCHSGTVTRALNAELGAAVDPRYIRVPYIQMRSVKDPPLTRQAIRMHMREEAFVQGGESRIVLTAVSAAQKALVDQELPMPSGVFTHRLIQGLEMALADLNSNGLVTYAELLDYLQQESESYCNRHKAICQLGLTPTLEAEPATLLEPIVNRTQATHSVAETFSDALAHDNNAQIDLQLLPGPRVIVGQTVNIKVTSQKDGYLMLLDIDTAGRLVQIFPNRYSDRAGKSNWVRAGQTIVVPSPDYGFELEAEPPLGDGILAAIITEDPVRLQALLNQHKDLKVISKPADYLTELTYRLRKTWHDDGANRRLRWSLAKVEYKVTP